jgi:hypothetical protein
MYCPVAPVAIVLPPPLILKVTEWATAGKSALVKLIGPNDEPLPVPITWCEVCPVAAPSVRVEPEIVQVSQFAPVAEQDVAPPLAGGNTAPI